MAEIISLDEFRKRYVPVSLLELRDNPAFSEVVAPLWVVPDDDPDDAA